MRSYNLAEASVKSAHAKLPSSSEVEKPIPEDSLHKGLQVDKPVADAKPPPAAGGSWWPFWRKAPAQPMKEVVSLLLLAWQT